MFRTCVSHISSMELDDELPLETIGNEQSRIDGFYFVHSSLSVFDRSLLRIACAGPRRGNPPRRSLSSIIFTSPP